MTAVPAWLVPEGMTTYAEYLAWQSGRGLSPTTLRCYRWYCAHLAQLVDTDPVDWTPHVVAYVVADWEGLSRSSRQQRGAVVRGLLRRAGRDDLLRYVPNVGRDHTLPRPAPDRTVMTVWLLPDGPARRGLLLAGYCGLRVAEIAAVRWSDLDLDAGTLRVGRGKGGRTRVVPVCAPLLVELRSWSHRDSPWVVVDRRGHPYMPQSLTRTLSEALPPGVTAHMLRHWSATWALRTTGNLLAVQQYLGHASPATTAGYTLLDDREVRRAVAGLPVPA